MCARADLALAKAAEDADDASRVLRGLIAESIAGIATRIKSVRLKLFGLVPSITEDLGVNVFASGVNDAHPRKRDNAFASGVSCLTSYCVYPSETRIATYAAPRSSGAATVPTVALVLSSNVSIASGTSSYSQTAFSGLTFRLSYHLLLGTSGTHLFRAFSSPGAASTCISALFSSYWPTLVRSSLRASTFASFQWDRT